MKNFNKIEIFENDIEFQGLADVLMDSLEYTNLPYEVWWNFNTEIIYGDGKANMLRFSQISKDTLCVCYPSFVGLGNSIDGYLRLLAKLKENNINLDIVVIKYDNFIYELASFLNRINSKFEYTQTLTNLTDILVFHNLYYLSYEDVIISEKPYTEAKHIKIEDITCYIYRKDELFKIKATGEICKAYSTGIYEKNMEKSYVSRFNENGKFDSSKDNFLLSEIEKV
jgi:hypothetical protein